jgi:hypothetical protein
MSEPNCDWAAWGAEFDEWTCIPIWIDKQGRTHIIKNMDTHHIQCCMRLLERENLQYNCLLGPVYDTFKAVLSTRKDKMEEPTWETWLISR